MKKWDINQIGGDTQQQHFNEDIILTSPSSTSFDEDDGIDDVGSSCEEIVEEKDESLSEGAPE